MADDLHATASRLRRVRANEPVQDVYATTIPKAHSAIRADEERVVVAYLAEHDPTPVAEELLRVLGFAEEHGLFTRGPVAVWRYDFGWYVSVKGGSPLGFDKDRGPLTAGAVGALLRALTGEATG